MKKINDWIWQDLQIVDSTNNVAKEIILKLKKKCVVTAIEQTNGRGRRGNCWISNKGNLFASFAFEIQPQYLSETVILSAVALLKTIQYFIKNCKVEVKWPNDILVNGKKISGILFENAFDNFWVMGIGINVSSGPEIENTNYKTTSMKDLGTISDRLAVLEHFTNVFDEIFKQYYINGFEEIRRTWLDNAYNLGNCVAIKQEKNIIEGVFLTIDEHGVLVLKTENEIKKIVVGDLFIKES